MILRQLENKIRKAFSEAAPQYELFASLQKEIGRELTAKIINQDNCSRILDIGMGTGWMAYRLHFLFPDAQIIGLDLSDGMVKWAKEKYSGFKVVQADGNQLPFQNSAFDVIISNLAFQWLGDLEKAFNETFRTLDANGQLCVTIFGYETLRELFTALEKTADRPSEGGLAINRLADAEAVRQAVAAAGFRNVHFQKELIKMHFEDMSEILQWLKSIGANSLTRDVFVGRDWLQRANKYYKNNFKDQWGVYASFEVIWVKADK